MVVPCCHCYSLNRDAGCPPLPSFVTVAGTIRRRTTTTNIRLLSPLLSEQNHCCHLLVDISAVDLGQPLPLLPRPNHGYLPHHHSLSIAAAGHCLSQSIPPDTTAAPTRAHRPSTS
ncbi:hypothetical protein Hanom_Chr02g00174421 [Helianthus anomalus]